MADPALLDTPPGGLRVTATLEAVRELASFLRERCAADGVDEASALDLELALVEAANNIVEHGYAGGEGQIAMQVEIAPERTTVTLRDSGLPMPDGLFERCRPVAPDSESGRGVAIVLSCIDTIHYRRGGSTNELILEKIRS